MAAALWLLVAGIAAAEDAAVVLQPAEPDAAAEIAALIIKLEEV